MGCLCPKFRQALHTENKAAEETPKFSWDNRPQVNVQDYTISNVKDNCVGRMPGTVEGQQFIIEKCENTSIYIFDHIATVTIDDCINCNIFLGPVKTSVFMRDCKDCKLMVACQQFRTRDCTKIDTFLLCTTKPIIESSTAMKFACFQYYYPELEEQFRSAKLSTFNNNWSGIFDFTEVAGESNISLLPPDIKVEDYIPLPTTEPLSNLEISTESCQSVVPLTLGTQKRTSDESSLIVFFNDGSSHDRAVKFMETMKAEHPDVVLVQSSEVVLESDEVERVFGSQSYQTAAKQGPVIGLELCGDNVIKYCQDQIVNIMKGTTGLVFVSQNKTLAKKQIENFFNYADMQMKI